MKTKQPAELIEQLVAEGGAIVTSQECSIIEIADAQATGRWAVDDEGIGYVRRYREWLDRHKTCESKVRRQLETWKRTIRNRNGITWNEMDAGDTLRLRKSIVEIEAALKLDATERDLVATIERENMKRNLSEAVNMSCSCGGNPAEPEACPACMVWHRMSTNEKVERQSRAEEAAYYSLRVEALESAIADAIMHLDTNYDIDGNSMKHSDAATALRRVLPNDEMRDR